MKIDTTKFRDIPRLTSATLSESADGPSALTLAFEGYGPEWLRWMEPVTLMHKGRVIFHGRITSFARSNEADALSTTATAQNALWLLDNMPLGAQVAEVEAASTSYPVNLAGAAMGALQNWATLAESCHVSAPGWAATPEGEPREDAEISLNVERANFSCAGIYKQTKLVTAWTALLCMRQANPDAYYRYNNITGEVEVISIANADHVTWDVDAMRLEAAADISPQYENCITGVALVVTWGDPAVGGGSVVRTYPEGISPGDMGVKLFSATVDSPEEAEMQADHMMPQIESYYEAANMLLHGGAVRALMDDIEVSPLCARLSVTGTRTHESWHDMAAMVTAVEWDFVAGVVEAQLGATIDEPTIDELEFYYEETETVESSSSTEETTTESGNWPPPPSSSSTTTEAEWEWPTRESTTTEEASTTWEWPYTTTWRSSSSTTEGGGMSFETKTDGEWGDTDTEGEWGDTESGNSGDTEELETYPTESRAGCDCAEDRRELRRLIEELTRRIDGLKQCECGSRSEGTSEESALWEAQRLFNMAVWAYLFNTQFGLKGYVSFPGLGDIMAAGWQKSKGLDDYDELFQP